VPVKRPRCYLASPLGFSELGRQYYEDTYIPTLAQVIEPVDPWSLVTKAELEEARLGGSLRKLWTAVGRRNSEAIRSSALLVAFLDGQELDAGTVAELGYAAALGKPCFGLRTDLRQIGDETVGLNLQVESFVAESGGEIVTSLAELVEVLGRAAMQQTR
jgi:nucleoside 2-deoxyribosyltransferase